MAISASRYRELEAARQRRAAEEARAAQRVQQASQLGTFEQNRANSLAGRLAPAIQGREVDALSQQYGFSSTAFNSTQPGEISGQDKLNKYQDAGLHQQSGSNRAASPTALTTAQAQPDFNTNVNVARGEGESNESYMARVERAKRIKIENIAKGVYADNQTNRLASALQQRESAFDIDFNSDEIPAYEKEYNDALARIENQRQAAVDSEFNKRIGNISVVNKNTYKALSDKLRASIKSKYAGQFNNAKQKLEDFKRDGKIEYDNRAKQNELFNNSQSLKDQSQIQKEGWIENQLSLNPNQNIAYLENKWTSINKYDGKGEKEAQLGRTLDAILESENTPLRKFEQVYETAGNNIDEAYKALKSRVGEYEAKNIKNDFLRARGWDEETIEEEDYTDTIQSLYSGELGGYLGLTKLMKESKSLGLPDEFLASQLEVIANSPNSDVNTKIMAQTFLKGFQPEEEFEFKTVGKQLFRTNSKTGEAEAVGGSISPVGNSKKSVSTFISNTTARASSTVPKEVLSVNPEFKGLKWNSPEMDYANDEMVNYVLSGFDDEILSNARIVLDPLSGQSADKIYGSTKDEKPLARKLNTAVTILRKQILAKDESGGRILLSAGESGKLTQSDREVLETANRAVSMLGDLEGVFQARDKRGTAFAKNVFDSKFNPFNVSAREANAIVQGLTPTTARGLFGEVGVLTDADIARYKKLMPTLTDTQDVRNALFGIMYKTAAKSLSNKLEGLSNAKIDVSRYYDDYQRLNSLAEQYTTNAESTITQNDARNTQSVADTTFTVQDLEDVGLGGYVQNVSQLPIETQTLFGEDFNSQPELVAEFIRDFGLEEYINSIK